QRVHPLFQLPNARHRKPAKTPASAVTVCCSAVIVLLFGMVVPTALPFSMMSTHKSCETTPRLVSCVGGSLNNLAELYRSQGRLSETEPLYKRALAVTEHALGSDHPSVAFVLNNLGLLYKSQAAMPTPSSCTNAALPSSSRRGETATQMSLCL